MDPDLTIFWFFREYGATLDSLTQSGDCPLVDKTLTAGTISSTVMAQRSAARRANISLLLLIFAGVVGLYDMTTHMVPFGKGFEMVALAQNLARTGSFANPFAVLNTGPSAANPPLYPFLLALLFRVCGSADLVALVATLLNILTNTFTALLLVRISEMFYDDMRPGVVAAVLWILSTRLMPCWDVGLTILLLLIFCLNSGAKVGKSGFAISALISGVLAGALLLLNPSMILIFIPWMAWSAYHARKTMKQAIGYSCIVCGILGATGAAWEVRNHAQLGKFLIRTNLGISLYSSNNDCAEPSFIASEANNCLATHHPNTSLAEARLVASLGEVNYDRMRGDSAKAWIRAHPEQFFRLTLARIRDFWFPVPGEYLFKSAVIWFGTLLSIPGLLWMMRKRAAVTSFVITALVIYPAVYYVVLSDIRYRMPVLWLSFLPAGYFLVQLWDRRKRTQATAMIDSQRTAV